MSEVLRGTAATAQETPTAPPGRARVDMTAEITRYWWSRRLFILKSLAICIIVYVILLLIAPEKYRAQATVIILPPRFTTEVRAEPLSVATAKSLLSNSELLQQVIDRIRLSRIAMDKWAANNKVQQTEAALMVGQMEDDQVSASLATDPDTASYISSLGSRELETLLQLDERDLADWTVEDIADSFASEDVVEKKTAAEIKLSPLLNLIAVAESGPKAQLLANTWASLFKQKYDEITRQKTGLQAESIRKQQEQSVQALKSVQDELIAFRRNHNIELYQRLIDEHSRNFTEFTNQYVQKRANLMTQRGKLAEYLNLVNALEQDGEFVGLVKGAEMETGETDPERTTQSEELELEGTIRPSGSVEVPVTGTTEQSDQLYQSMRTKSIDSRAKLISAIARLHEFRKAFPLELLEKERDRLQTELLESMSRLRKGEVQLAVLEKSLASVDAQLSQTQPFITLNTGVPDQAVAEAIAENRRQDLSTLAQLNFNRQEINPVWAELQAQRLKLNSEFQNTRNEVSELGNVLGEKQELLKRFQEVIYTARVSEGLVQQNVDRWQESNRELFESYVDTNNQIFNTARQIALLEQDVMQLEQQTSESESLVQEFQQKFNAASAEQQRLEARQRAIQRNSDLLLQKLQEAQIANSQDVSDVSIAARAIMPSKHFFPPRTILLVVLTIATLAFLLALLARQRYMQLATA